MSGGGGGGGGLSNNNGPASGLLHNTGPSPLLPRTISVDTAVTRVSGAGGVGLGVAGGAMPAHSMRALSALQEEDEGDAGIMLPPGAAAVHAGGAGSSLMGAGTLYRSLTAPSMSGYLGYLLPRAESIIAISPRHPQHDMHAARGGATAGAGGPAGGHLAAGTATGGARSPGRDFFMMPDEYMDMAELLLQDAAATPPAAAAAAAAAASAFARSPTAAAAAANVKADPESSSAATGSDMSGDKAQPATPNSAAAVAVARLGLAAAGGAIAHSPRALSRQLQGASPPGTLTDEQALFTAWRDQEAGARGGQLLPAGTSGGVLLPGASGSMAHHLSSNSSLQFLQFPSTLQHQTSAGAGSEQALLIRGSGSLSHAASGLGLGSRDAFLLPGQHALVGAGSLGGLQSMASAATAAAAAAAAATGLSTGQLLQSAMALPKASSSAAAAVVAAAAGSTGAATAAGLTQLPPVPALRLTPPSLTSDLPAPNPAAAAAAAAAATAAAAANMRTISSVTNDLSAALLMNSSNEAPAAGVPAAAAATATGQHAASPTANNDVMDLEGHTNDGAGGVGVEVSEEEPQAAPVMREDSLGRITRARSKGAVVGAGGGVSDGVSGGVSDRPTTTHSHLLERSDSGVTHPKKRARVGPAPGAMAAAGAAGAEAASKPTGPAPMV